MESSDAAPKLRQKRERARTFALTWLAYASYYLGRKSFSVVKSTMSEQLGLGAPTLAAIETAYLCTYAVGQVPSGVAADRIGARALVGIGMLLSAVACALFGAGHSALAFGCAYALNGLAQATGWPGTTRAMAEHTDGDDRGRVMGVWSTCYQVGGMAATALATFLLAQFGWRATFFAPALWLAVVGAVMLTFLPSRGSQPAIASSSVAFGGREAPRRLFLSPVIYGYGACYFCLKLIRYSLLFWLPYYLHTSVGFSETQAGYLSISFELGGTVGSVGLGYASDRLGRSRASSAIVSLLGLAAALLLYARLGHGSALAHFGTMALVGALLFGPDSLLSGAAAQDAGGPRAAATAVGIVNGLGSLGALLQGALTVGIQQHFGWSALFYVFVGLALVASACLLPSLSASSRA